MVHKMAAKPGDGGIAKQKGKKKKRECVAVLSSFSSTFPHQFLAVVVVIVYGFGRRLVSSSFSSSLLFLNVCVEDGVEVFSRPYIYPSIAGIILLLFFFSFVVHNEN
jgi:hypothetical protein